MGLHKFHFINFTRQNTKWGTFPKGILPCFLDNLWIFFFLFSAVVETHIFSHQKMSQPLIIHATNRLVLYIVPITLLLINASFSWAYLYHIKTLRDAVRTWDAITPSVPHFNSSRRSTLQPTSVRTSIYSTTSPGTIKSQKVCCMSIAELQCVNLTICQWYFTWNQIMVNWNYQNL